MLKDVDIYVSVDVDVYVHVKVERMFLKVI